MKIYTRGGDKGRTSLFSGGRVDKDDTRIEALGSVDELVAVLGVARATLGEGPAEERIEALQTELYLLMADLASDAEGDGRLPESAVTALEGAIDMLEADLPPLTEFIVPGASPGSAALHVARTVCRRAERRVGTARRTHPLPVNAAIYLNRLSDLLFVLSRWVDRAEPAAGRTFKDNL